MELNKYPETASNFRKSSQQTAKRSLIYILIFGIATVILWQFPFGNYILYPFTILGTWFHEMGHGLAAMLLGGNFNRLEIYPDGSGMAQYSGDLALGNLGRAVVAAAGPLGPLISGFIFITSSRKSNSARWLELLTGLLMLISIIFWVRSFVGVSVILLVSIVCLYIAIKSSPKLHTVFAQFLGVQSYTSVYLSTGYLLSDGGVVGGRQLLSDTAQISNYLVLPYWFWGGMIIVISIIVIIYSLKLTMRNNDVRL